MQGAVAFSFARQLIDAAADFGAALSVALRLLRRAVSAGTPRFCLNALSSRVCETQE